MMCILSEPPSVSAQKGGSIMGQVADSVIVEPSFEYDCSALNKLSADHKSLVTEYCPKCQGYGSECLVDQMELVSKSFGDNPCD